MDKCNRASLGKPDPRHPPAGPAPADRAPADRARPDADSRHRRRAHRTPDLRRRPAALWHQPAACAARRGPRGARAAELAHAIAFAAARRRAGGRGADRQHPADHRRLDGFRPRPAPDAPLYRQGRLPADGGRGDLLPRFPQRLSLPLLPGADRRFRGAAGRRCAWRLRVPPRVPPAPPVEHAPAALGVQEPFGARLSRQAVRRLSRCPVRLGAPAAGRDLRLERGAARRDLRHHQRPAERLEQPLDGDRRSR